MSTQPSERPMVFSGPMVQAILEGRKTVTRLLLNPQPIVLPSLTGPRRQKKGDVFVGPDLLPTDETKYVFAYAESRGVTHCLGTKEFTEQHGPYQVGDHLWVREAFAVQPSLWAQSHGPQPIHYLASTEREQIEDYVGKPSIHMPRWASRITLEVVSVRVERLQDITSDDALDEGINLSGIPGLGSDSSIIKAFSTLWDRTYAKRGLGWVANPWVWVISFKPL